MGQSQNTIEYEVLSKYSDFADILGYSKTFLFPVFHRLRKIKIIFKKVG